MIRICGTLAFVVVYIGTCHQASHLFLLNPMRKVLFLSAFLLMVTVGSLFGHDLFLKLPSYFLKANASATVALFNGTFQKSDNVITRPRMQDVSIVNGEGVVRHPDTTRWYEEGTRTLLDIATRDAGTYVLGVSIVPRVIDLSAQDFNDYLRHDGVLDVLSARKAQGLLDQPATERYAKHVKAIVQVGDTRTNTYHHRLNYPVEIVPQQNPYAQTVGDTLRVRVFREGAPLSQQRVYASHEEHHGNSGHSHQDGGMHREAVQTRTDEHGIAHIPLTHAGRWYVRLIHMEAVTEPRLDYVSNWATLTFEIL